MLARFFSEEFRRDHASEVETIRTRLLRMSAQGYAGCGAAIRDMALLDRITQIAAPTLIVAGSKDVSTPFDGHGSELQKRIPQARVTTMPTAHLAPVEMPDAFAAIVTAFLSGASYG